MNDATSMFNESTTGIEWMWNANTNPFSKSQPVEWKPYSDVENMIIEEAFQAGQDHVVLDNYSIDFKHNIQVLNEDGKKQRPIKRMTCSVDTNYVREERFTYTPISSRRPFGGLYGWISPFITEVAKYLKITIDQLPSKDMKVISMIVEEAALGIVEEGKKIGKQHEAAKIAKILREKKYAVMKEVWECCAHLYSLDSFLYRKLNETMRLIGDKEYEQTWRDKVRTLGPFCLLLWDNPSNYQSTQNGTILYRGADLCDELVSIFKEDCLIKDKPVRSFQSLTSCTRDRAVAEMFGNVLFIMTVKHAFTVDLKPFSKYPDEEEELVSPGVCFTIDRVEFDQDKNKHAIYLELVQQYRQIDRDQISSSYVRGHYNDIPYIRDCDPDDDTTYPLTPPGDRNGDRFNDWI